MKDYKLSEIKKICKVKVGAVDGDNDAVCKKCPIHDWCFGELKYCIPAGWEIEKENNK